MTRPLAAAVLLTAAVAANPSPAADDDGPEPAPAAVLAPARERFAAEGVAEVPDFQRHVLPLMGRLGCNTRSCHGSFQGRGGFRLSLFGYDFKADHDSLLAKDSGRVDADAPELSKVLEKPTLAVPHKGGKRVEPGGWAYRILERWIGAGAKGVEAPSHFDRLEVTPSEVVFDAEGGAVPLRVTAYWSDGTAEDVTCLSRFRTNDESVAEVSEDGLVTGRSAGDTHVVAFYDNGVAVTQVLRPVSDKTGDRYPEVPTPTKVDALVVDKLRKLGVVPSEVCGDAEFLRRASLDLTGTLPTPAEVEAFLDDRSPAKREAKVDELLARPTYSAYWATKLCDVTGATPRVFNNQPLPDVIVRQWYAWVERRVRENVPYDKIVEGLLLATSRAPGESYEAYTEAETGYYRDKEPADFAARETMPHFWSRRTLNQPEEKALNVSYAFLGVRLDCAQCHKHPFDQWTQDDFKQFTAFFTPVRFGLGPDARPKALKLREDLGLDKLPGGQLQRELGRLAKDGKAVPFQEVFIAPGIRAAMRQGKVPQGQKDGVPRVATPKLLGGDKVDIAKVDDPRKPLMDWMRSKGNPYFARALVNRVWANDFGRGIVNPPDDANLANPPGNAPLLAHLADGFVAHGFDLKWLHREILLSQTYQRSFRANDTNALDETNFSRSVVRRLPAEVLLDAIQQATAGSADLAKASADVAERAIGPKGGVLLARRGPGGGDFASRVFGRSQRDTNCDCSSSNEPNLLQSIFLQNDNEVFAAIDRRGGWLRERTGADAKERSAAESGLAALETRVKAIEKEKAALEAETGGDGDGEADKADDGKVKDVDRRLARRTEERDALRARLRALPSAEAPAPFDAGAVVREAYLRALGRRPTGAEADRALDYVKAAPNEAQGMRDLVWALLNTKEFVTNH